jgi:hypothetical protein
MLRQTINLFVKALIIGVLLSLGLQQVPAEPVSPAETSSTERLQPPLTHSFIDR